MPIPRTRFGKYEILTQLGSGGMGSVFLAHDPTLGREVAIKVLRGPMIDEELRARFLREARATANLHHPNIITIYEVGEVDQQPFIAMEYVAGESLASVIAERRPAPLATRLHYLEQLCAGLHFAHRAGIVHRDVKPANLMVDAEGVIRILDFGIARLEGSGMTMDGALMGTVNYMSPEQMLGRQVDLRSDIFAVGAVAYELISYCQAFPGTFEELLHRLPNEASTPLPALCPGIDPAIEPIVARALAKQPDQRYQELAEMQAAISDLRRTILADRGAGFVLATPAAPVAPASTLRRSASPRGHDDELKAKLLAASRCLDDGNHARAAELAHEVIDRSPSSVEAHALLIRAHRAMAGDDTAGRRSGRGDSQRLQKRRRITVLVAGTGTGLAVAAAITAAMMGVFDGGHENRSAIGDPLIAPAPVTHVEVASGGPPESAPAIPTASGAANASAEAAARGVIAEVEQTRLAAVRASAGELASKPFHAASATAELARRAYTRGSYMDAASAGSTAARQFTESVVEAEREGERRRAAAVPSAPEASPVLAAALPIVTTQPAVGVPSNPEPVAAAAPPVMPPPAAVESSPTPTAVNPISRERPAILAALEQYRSAYQNRSIDALKAVYPTLSGEELQARARAFKDRKGCRALDVRFGDPIVSLTADATVAHVDVMSTYVCMPVTGQARPQEPLPDVFQMRKNGEAWVITLMGAMGR